MKIKSFYNYFKEGWNNGRTILSRDNKIADEIIANFNNILNIRLVETQNDYKRFQFNVKTYNFEIYYNIEMGDYVHPGGYYEIKMEGRVLDISWLKSRKIYKHIEKAWKENDDDEQYFKDKKKDFLL